MSLARSHHIAEAERACAQVKHRAVRCDQRLAGQLAGAIGRNRNQWPEIFQRFEVLQIAIHSAAGRVEQIRRVGAAHGLHNLLRQKGAFAKIDIGFHGGARDIGIRGQMNYRIVAVHIAFKRGQIFHVAADHAQPAVLLMMRVMPLPAARKIVVERDGFGALVAQQTVCKMAADEPGATRDEIPRGGRTYGIHGSDSHLVATRCNSGWLTSKCQSTAHRPSVCGVIRSGASAGITMHSSAIWRVNPPLRPTMPKMCAPASDAVSSARTIFTDTFFSRLPPPTENTSTPSRAPMREPLSQAAKHVSQPSSLARAVSSETLSVGA